MPASLALPKRARREGVNDKALAFWAERLAAVIREPDRHELGMGFIVGHPQDGTQAQGPGFRAQKET